MKNINIDYVRDLKKELKAVMGCTEPAAAALAGAMARELLERTPEKVVVQASRDVIKNVMGVGIPNSSVSGLASAVLLGVLHGNSRHGLNLLSKIVDTDEKQLLSFTDEKRISVSLVTGKPPFFIKVIVQHEHSNASVTIADEHDKVVEKTKNGNVIFTEKMPSREHSIGVEQNQAWDLYNIFHYITTCNPENLSFLVGMAETNLAIGLHGLEHPYGLQVGRVMYGIFSDKPNTLNEAFDYAALLAASGSDARMAGCTYPVVINSGSGNQGLTAMVPPLVVGSYLNSEREKISRALALSNLVAIYLARYKGRLSALCGAFTAAIGSCCAFVYLMGGNLKQIENAIQLMLANLTGVVCDGAKQTCALKIHSCLQSAGMTARLVIQDGGIHEPVGIVGDSYLTSLKHLEILCHEGLEATDNAILSIMVGAKTAKKLTE